FYVEQPTPRKLAEDNDTSKPSVSQKTRQEWEERGRTPLTTSHPLKHTAKSLENKTTRNRSLS
ncbi:hypothetical protein V5799_026090, partial [Amblyomma americanum]